MLGIGSGEVTPQKVFLRIDSDKQGYIEYPDGTYQATVAGVIDTTWNHSAGDIRLIVPKNTSKIFITDLVTSSLLGGVFITNTSADLFLSGWNIVGVSASNSLHIYAFGCSLNSAAIDTLLSELVSKGNQGGILNLLGGRNANYSTWTAQAQSNLLVLANELNWTVSYVGE